MRPTISNSEFGLNQKSDIRNETFVFRIQVSSILGPCPVKCVDWRELLRIRITAKQSRTQYSGFLSASGTTSICTLNPFEPWILFTDKLVPDKNEDRGESMDSVITLFLRSTLPRTIVIHGRVHNTLMFKGGWCATRQKMGGSTMALLLALGGWGNPTRVCSRHIGYEFVMYSTNLQLEIIMRSPSLSSLVSATPHNASAP